MTTAFLLGMGPLGGNAFAQLQSAFTMPLGKGAYALTGQSLTAIHGRIISLGTGTYAVSGENETLIGTHLVRTVAGTYALAGNSVVSTLGAKATIVASPVLFGTLFGTLPLKGQVS